MCPTYTTYICFILLKKKEKRNLFNNKQQAQLLFHSFNLFLFTDENATTINNEDRKEF